MDDPRKFTVFPGSLLSGIVFNSILSSKFLKLSVSTVLRFRVRILQLAFFYYSQDHELRHTANTLDSQVYPCTLYSWPILHYLEASGLREQTPSHPPSDHLCQVVPYEDHQFCPGTASVSRHSSMHSRCYFTGSLTKTYIMKSCEHIYTVLWHKCFHCFEK